MTARRGVGEACRVTPLRPAPSYAAWRAHGRCARLARRLPGPAMRLPLLPYRKPTPGRDYWVIDDALPDARGVARALPRADRLDRGLARTSRKAGPGCAASRRWTRPNWRTSKRWCARPPARRSCGWKPRPTARASTTTACRWSAPASANRDRIPIRSPLCRYAAVLYLNPVRARGLRHRVLPPAPARRPARRQFRVPAAPQPGRSAGDAFRFAATPSPRTCAFPTASIACCCTAPTSSTAPPATAADPRGQAHGRGVFLDGRKRRSPRGGPCCTAVGCPARIPRPPCPSEPAAYDPQSHRSRRPVVLGRHPRLRGEGRDRGRSTTACRCCRIRPARCTWATCATTPSAT